jgi:two-component system response regulator AlgR
MDWCAEQFSHLNPRPAIIFCTAYDQHALEAFKFQAQGYFLSLLTSRFTAGV